MFLLPAPASGDEARALTGIELARIQNGNVLDAYGTGVFGVGVTRSEASKRMLERLGRLSLKEINDGLNEEEQAEQERLRAVLPTTGPGETSLFAHVTEPSPGREEPSGEAP